MMSPHEFSGAVLVRAAVLGIGNDMSWPECRKLAIKQLAAEHKLDLKRHPRRSPPAPQLPPSSDLRGELATAKDRFFGKLQAYFERFDARRAAEKVAKKAARKAERAARRLAKINPAPARPDNVVPLHRPDAPQPEVPAPEFAGPLVYGGNISSAVRLVDERPSPATVGWRDSIERNERLQQQRSKPS